jgi:hypothetical protein
MREIIHTYAFTLPLDAFTLPLDFFLSLPLKNTGCSSYGTAQKYGLALETGA